MSFSLNRMLSSNQLLETVKADWVSQINDDEGMPVEQLEVYFNQAKRISSSKNIPDDKGMFVLVSEEGGSTTYDAMCYINHAFTKCELRVVNIYLAPRFDDREHMQISIAEIFAKLLSQFVRLARQGEWKSPALKMYLPDAFSRNFASSFASTLKLRDGLLTVEIIGSWLHIKGLDTLKAE
ncbi:hypothetical protein [Thalassospira australica]|uniref:hypothetical protein n=1 Tax=Thalassospira australica TaxID=1528106 RepID=UPI00385076E3